MFAYKYSLTTSQLVVQLEKVQCKPQKETWHTFKFYISAAANMFQKAQLLFKGSISSLSCTFQLQHRLESSWLVLTCWLVNGMADRWEMICPWAMLDTSQSQNRCVHLIFLIVFVSGAGTYFFSSELVSIPFTKFSGLPNTILCKTKPAQPLIQL